MPFSPRGDYVGPPVAAVIFSRSLHHLPLDAAVEHAKSLLSSPGRLIVEDFAFAEMPSTALAWLRSLLVRLAAEGVWQAPSDGFLAKVLARANPLPLSDPDHREIASADAMRQVLAAYGTLIHERPSAYFYRYLLPGLPDSPAGVAVLRRTLHEQTEAIATRYSVTMGRPRMSVQVDGYPPYTRRVGCERNAPFHCS